MPLGIFLYYLRYFYSCVVWHENTKTTTSFCNTSTLFTVNKRFPSCFQAFYNFHVSFRHYIQIPIYGNTVKALFQTKFCCLFIRCKNEYRLVFFVAHRKNLHDCFFELRSVKLCRNPHCQGEIKRSYKIPLIPSTETIFSISARHSRVSHWGISMVSLLAFWVYSRIPLAKASP